MTYRSRESRRQILNLWQWIVTSMKHSHQLRLETIFNAPFLQMCKRCCSQVLFHEAFPFLKSISYEIIHSQHLSSCNLNSTVTAAGQYKSLFWTILVCVEDCVFFNQLNKFLLPGKKSVLVFLYDKDCQNLCVWGEGWIGLGRKNKTKQTKRTQAKLKDKIVIFKNL